MLKNIKINCPHNTVPIDVLRIKPTVLYDTNSVVRKHFLPKFTVQYKPSQAKLGELCPPPGVHISLSHSHSHSWTHSHSHSANHNGILGLRAFVWSRKFKIVDKRVFSCKNADFGAQVGKICKQIFLFLRIFSRKFASQINSIYLV